jgi:peptidyl-prolyl cis-trans isomerase SurA
MRKFGIAVLSILLTISIAKAQTKSLDRIVAVVGGSIILQSDIEIQYAQYLSQGGSPNEGIKCQVLQGLVSQKILAAQAIIDSIDVKDDEVDNELDRRMRSSMARAGGQDKLEQFLGKSIIQYKDEIRPEIREEMVADKMKQHITEKVNVTPEDVENYFNRIPKDSLPTFNKEVEVGEIVFQPKLTRDEKAAFKQKAEDLRTRVKNGEDFGTLARLYSQDPQSAIEGGDLGFADRNTYVKEFAAWAFKLKAGEISPVFETDFGFHFLQVLERRGEQVHVRHILIIPTITDASLERAKAKADSVYKMVTDSNYDKKLNIRKPTFATAAAFYSDNRDTKFNGGMMLNSDNVENRTTFIPSDRLDPQVALVVDTMKVGEISTPQLFTDARGQKSYKILYLRTVIDAHKANLKQDFPKIKEAAFNDKINRTLSEWFEKRRKETYIRIDPQYQGCKELKGWATPASADIVAAPEDTSKPAATPAATKPTKQ